MLNINGLRFNFIPFHLLALPLYFHSGRHTAATLLLTLGANLYVVSKILGHKSIAMTEIYAKIVDKKKVETMNLVNDMFI